MYPKSHLVFLGRKYTKPVVSVYQGVDAFEEWDRFASLSKPEQIERIKKLNIDVIIHVFPKKEIATIAKKAGILMRIGTSHRVYHLWTCTHRVAFSRKQSPLHESQLNFELLRPLGLKELPSMVQLLEYTHAFQVKNKHLPKPFDTLRDFFILHPKSQGSAREWPLEKYMKLAKDLSKKGETVVFTGTEPEGLLFRDQLPKNEAIIDATGKLTLDELIVLISKSKGLVACSTGPLHIAGFLGIRTVGLFSEKRPIHPGRWKALGADVKIVSNPDCVNCKNGKECSCLENISVSDVFTALQ
jgi:ADP-heptose:LPS heptosyltransferase